MRIKEPISGGLHLVGAVLAIIGLGTLLQLPDARGSFFHLTAYSIFGSSLISLYLASSIHHLVPKRLRHAKLFRKVDHAMIFVLIAGTYTPICMIALERPTGPILLAIVWLLAALGVFLKFSSRPMSRRISTALYVGLGWVAIGAIVPIIRELSLAGFLWLLAGGVFYTLGAIIYGLRSPDPLPKVFGFHELFHVFVMAGSLSHFWTVFHYVR